MPDILDLESERTARAERETECMRAEVMAKCAAAIEAMEPGLAGFALVVWNKDGDLRTVYDASQGPIGPALLPTLVSDALNRHVAVMLAREAASDDSSAS